MWSRSEADSIVCMSELFKHYDRTELTAEKFTEKFMLSDFARNYDKAYSVYHGMGWAYAQSEFCFEESVPRSQTGRHLTKNETPTYIMEWIGWMYRCWHMITSESSETIYKKAPFKVLEAGYYGFHCMDERAVIDYITSKD